MATSKPKPKSATEQLQEKFGRLIDEAAKNMTDEEFQEAARRSKELTDRVRARASRREKA